MEYTKDVLKQVQSFVPDYEDGYSFLHCASCLKEKVAGVFGKGESPEEAMSYVAAAVPMPIKEKGKPTTNVGVVVVFCRRCKKTVWDSRHLTHAY